MNPKINRSATDYNNEWITPRPIIQRLGIFDLDPCSPIDRPFPTARKHFTILDDGLMQEWHGRVWLNPPYGKIEDWMRKMYQHDNGIALTFARTETAWFQELIWPQATSILFMKGRITFLTPSGAKAKGSAGAPSVLISYGEANMEALEKSGIEGKHLPVNYSKYILVGMSSTWFQVVSIAIRSQGDATDQLQPIYEAVERMAGDKISLNRHWKEKVRQQLQVYRRKQQEQLTLL